MAGLKRFQYVDKDHADIVTDVIARIKETYGEKAWNDFEEDSSGRMLLEAVAYVIDCLLFYLDRQANESYLPTATERQNLINICKLIGYKPAAAQPAQADITVSIQEPHATDVTLPAGTQIETQSGVTFETKADAVITAGETSVIVGATDQEFYLPRAGVIEVLEIAVGGHIWGPVDSVADHLPEDKIYTADMDAWGRCRITFGNGASGQIPREGETITAKYRIGGGVSGNVAPNTLINVRDIATDEDGNRVSVSVTNLGWAAGGSDPESAERIKYWAPRFFETQNRCVTQGDYETFAMSYNDADIGAIAKARAVVRLRSGEANYIRLYVLSYGSEAGTVAIAPQTLKEALLKHMNHYKQLTDWLEIEDGSWRLIDVRGTITHSAGMKSSVVIANVHSALETLMDVETRELGEPLRISDLYAAIDNVEGVIHVELETPTATITAEENELLILGTVSLSAVPEEAGLNGKNI